MAVTTTVTSAHICVCVRAYLCACAHICVRARIFVYACAHMCVCVCVCGRLKDGLRDTEEKLERGLRDTEEKLETLVQAFIRFVNY